VSLAPGASHERPGFEQDAVAGGTGRSRSRILLSIEVSSPSGPPGVGARKRLMPKTSSASRRPRSGTPFVIAAMVTISAFERA
jgi:hypothetical protein